MDNSLRERFGGIDRLYGSGALARLHACHVTVVGIGGVGSWAAEALARSGVAGLVLMAAYSLVLDFDNVQQGVRNGAPRKYGWLSAFGIMVTVVWLYVEILRILAIARSN